MKKVISLLLSALFIFTMCLPASAAAETKEVQPLHNDHPIVIVKGIDFASLVKEDGSNAIALDPVDLLGLIFEIGGHKALGDKNAVAKAIVNFGKNLFKDIALDKEGNPVNSGVYMPKYLHSAAKITDFDNDEKWADTAVGLFRQCARTFDANKVYLYTFDWRLSPSALAADLKSFFDLVVAETGAEKLDIAACSMGGMITTCYIDTYGSDLLDSVVYLSPAHNGADVVGSAFTGDLVIDAEFLTDFLVAKLNNPFLTVIVKILDFFGFFRSIAKFVNGVITTHKEMIYDDFLCEVFATAYGLWGLIPDEYYDDAVELFFDGKEGYDKALEEIAEIREFVFKTETIHQNLVDSGVKVSIVSHYDREQLPIYSKSYLHGDGVLESQRTSSGATFARFGETLSDAELAGVAAEYISPDKVVNASTCQFPNQTWIVKDVKHVGCMTGSDHTEMAIWLLTQDTQPTVYTNPAYPRFLRCDENQNFIAF